MIIGIDAQKAASKERTGPENFVYQLILNLKKIDHENIYYLYTNKSLPKELVGNNFKEQKIGIAKGWNKVVLPMLLRIKKPEAYLQPVDKIPKSAPKQTVAVVHDLAFKYFPEAYTEKENELQNETLKNYFERAQKIVCVSDSTMADYLKFFPESTNKCQVVYLGTNKIESNAATKSPYDFPYILSVGRLEERKNTIRIIEAFDQLKTEKRIKQKLVLVGKPGTGYNKVEEALNGAKNRADIILPGHIQPQKLQSLYANADLFLYPSLYEGFGLSLLEALAYGIPSISSNTSSIPEVAGNAALLINPQNIDELKEAIVQILSDEKLRNELKQKAQHQAEQFNWEKTALEYKKILENL